MRKTKTLIGFALCLLLLSCTNEEETITLVLLPDTQMYSERYPDIFHAQTAWIAKNADSISFVLHQGDITNHNTAEQWNVAASAMQRMDGRVPYAFCIGNHDIGTNGSADIRNTDLFNEWFPYSQYQDKPGFGGAMESGKMDNTWSVFHAAGLDWLVLSLEFGPRNRVLDWAGKVIEAHPEHQVIINTHAYMYSDDTRMSAAREHHWLPQHYGLGKATGDDAVNDGEAIWEKLVSQYPKVRFVFSGHVLNDGVGTLTSEGKHGNAVYQMLANYQTGVEGSEFGGSGFLRILKIDLKRQLLSVKTYSPYLNSYKTAEDQQFTIPLQHPFD